MNKALVIVLLLGCSFVSCFAQDLSDDELEQAAKRTLAALLQYTNSYRFSSNLTTGDFVKYRFINSDGSVGFVELRVISKTEDSTEIHETFHGNELHIVFNNQMEITSAWGADEFGYEEVIQLLPSNEVVPEVRSMLNDFEQEAVIQSYRPSVRVQSNSTLAITTDSEKVIPVYNQAITSKINQDQLAQLEEATAYYFNEDIPKMLPHFYAAIPMLMNEECTRSTSKGLLRNAQLEVVDFHKGQSE